MGFTDSIQSFFHTTPKKYASKEQLVEGLCKMDSAAIEYVLSKTEHLVKKSAVQYGLSEQIALDALHDGIVLLIEKIQNNQYDPNLSAPPTFLVGICSKILANQSRQQPKITFEPLDSFVGLENLDLSDCMDIKGKTQLLQQLLDELGPPGNDLIRLKYLEGFRDEEIMAQKMTPYNTPESLRSARSQSMKKLAVLAKKWKEVYYAS